MTSLSPAQARKLVLLSQGLNARSSRQPALTQTHHHIESLGYVQIDTISVVQRAHHHVLWSRNPGYHPTHLEQLVADKQVFEYWSHAAAYLPMQDYRFTLPRKLAIKSDRQSHWYKKDEPLMSQVLKRIELEGPLMSKDFESRHTKKGGWGAKPAKRALENLFMQGDLMICRREGFHKVYDLTERVLPEDVNTSAPTAPEYARYLIDRFLKSHGLATPAEMTYLLKGIKKQVEHAVDELLESGELQQLEVGENRYLALSGVTDLLKRRLSQRKVCLLSPFDNLLIQRKRALNLFDFDYQLECYVPETKRRFGYFCLPILWQSGLIGRADCKADKKTQTLQVRRLFIEKKLRQPDAFWHALDTELTGFARFNGCQGYVIEKLIE